MGASKTQIMNYLEMRFDYQSARNVLNNWRRDAGIKDELESLNDCQLKCLLSYLKVNAADATRVHAAIERLILSDGEACCDAPAEVVEVAEVVEAPVVEAEAAEVVEAPVVEAEVAEVVEAPVEAVADENVEAPVEAVADENAEAPAPKKSKKKSKH